jgi:feruloyl esterase
MIKRSALGAVAVLGFAPVSQLLAAADCGSIAELAPGGMRITEAVATPATAEVPVAHCIVRGKTHERMGADGNAYAVSFELRLPDEWSGRFMHQFNGGNDGAVVPALGRFSTMPAGDSALARGFAVVSSDAGHDGAAHPDAGLAGGNVFGLEFEARKDYGYAAVSKLQPLAIALTESYYGTPVSYTYGGGSSNGGRHAMIAASRMFGSFDGLLAGYPGFHLPRAAVQHAWDVQAFHSVGDTLADSFSRQELGVVAAQVLAACDGLDGVEDGLVFDVTGCQNSFEPASMECRTNGTDNCLPAAKVDALARILGGPRNSAGEQLYSAWAWDTGLASEGWRTWKIESRIPPWGMRPIISVMGAGSLAQVFSTPPTSVQGDPQSLENFLLQFDFDRDAPKIDATSSEFPESAMELMTPPDSDNPRLDGLESSGGRLVVFHGVSDPVFSFLDTASWYEALLENKPDATEFTRLYAVPGMPHGPGGVAPDEFDALSALVAWVEDDIVPGAIVAKVREDNENAPESLRGAERPLCPWPAVATYTRGNTSSAQSFDCVTPE